jgi:hypothetical protein
MPTTNGTGVKEPVSASAPRTIVATRFGGRHRPAPVSAASAIFQTLRTTPATTPAAAPTANGRRLLGAPRATDRGPGRALPVTAEYRYGQGSRAHCHR